MQSLFGVVIDSGPQVFQVPPRAAWRTPPTDIIAAGLAVHISEKLGSPPFIEALNSAIKGAFVRLSIAAVGIEDREDIRDLYRLYVAFAARRPVLLDVVFCERSLRSLNRSLSASCGDMLGAVNDDPGAG